MPDSEQDILREARDRFRKCNDWYSSAHDHFREDFKFANGDSFNWYQWEEAIRTQRTLDNMPILTINKVRQHNLQIINDGRQNKSGIKVRPVGGGATFDAAQMMAGIIRHIEYQSNASSIYTLASGFQVAGGVGYWRVVTDYVSPTSFEQDIWIKPILDPLGVYLDPDCKEPDKSDAKYGFIFEDVPKERFDRDYPEFKGISGQSTLDNNVLDWKGDSQIRKCEYYRIIYITRTLISIPDPTGDGDPIVTFTDVVPGGNRSEIIRAILAQFKEQPDNPAFKKRRVQVPTVEWKYIVGNKIIDEKLWLGSTIPIVAVLGEETIIDGRYDCKGHTRALRDAQRMYNWWSSSSVQYGALQTKTPWLGPAKAFEGYEDYWTNANKQNTAFLPYNIGDDLSNPIPPPQRIEPPVSAPAALAGMQMAQMEMMMASGQYEANFGQQGNERTGRAINEKERQGDTATYHYIDNQAIALRRTGKILIDLIPKIYDTERVLMAIAENGDDFELKVDPQAAQAAQVEQGKTLETAVRILNPNVGTYEVRSEPGPAFGTRREEAFTAFTLLLTQAPQLVSVIGDLLLKAGDFPLADEAARRLKRLVPPAALGLGPSESEQQLQMQLEQLKGVAVELLNEIAQKDLQLKSREKSDTTNEYKAVTERAKVAGDQTMAIFKLAVEQAMRQMEVQQRREELEGQQGSLNGAGSSDSDTEMQARLSSRMMMRR